MDSIGSFEAARPSLQSSRENGTLSETEASMKESATWKDDIHRAIEQLGRPASALEIFHVVKGIRFAAGRSVTKHSRHGVRRILMEHFVITEKPNGIEAKGNGPYFWLPRNK